MDLRIQLESWSLWAAACMALLCVASAGCGTTNGWAANHTGKSYYQRGQYAQAREEFRRAAIDDPRNPEYRHNLALAMKKTGDTAGAERVLRTNLEHVSAMHQPTYHTLSQLLVEQNRQAEAQDLLHGWTETQPYIPESHVEFAWIQRESGNLPGAEQSLRRALQTNPRNAAALAQMGQLYQDSGQPQQAASMYRRSLASRWQQPGVRSRLQSLAGFGGRGSRSAVMANPVGVQPTFAQSSPMPMAVNNTPVMASQPAPSSMSAPTPWMAAAPSLGPTPDPIASASPSSAMPSTRFEPPVVSGSALTPNADPAHVETELTADVPLVAPY